MPATTVTEDAPEVAQRAKVVTSNGRPVAVIWDTEYVQANYNDALDFARRKIGVNEGLAIRASQDESRVMFAADENLALKVDAVKTNP